MVLMSAHGQEGAMGVVLNRPTGKRLGEIQGEFALGPLAAAPVFSGGPVQVDRLILVAWQSRNDGFQLHFGIDPARAGQLMSEDHTKVRAYLGHSGWSAGQLEEELKRSTWVVTDAPVDLFDQVGDERLWREALAKQGDRWRLLADEPDDPEQN
jgi:putative transcriptional regulator